MKSSLFLSAAALAVLLFGQTARAQTPTLEFAPGVGNPTGNGPTTTNQVITLQNNTDNPTGNTYLAYSPVTITTISLSNQQYTNGTNQGIMFGGSTGDINAPSA